MKEPAPRCTPGRDVSLVGVETQLEPPVSPGSVKTEAGRVAGEKFRKGRDRTGWG